MSDSIPPAIANNGRMAARRGWPETNIGDFEGEPEPEHRDSNEGPTGTLVE